ncbi:MAG: hypothetical protein AMXMBFR56_54560 [Polyangiaceae bacterium]
MTSGLWKWLVACRARTGTARSIPYNIGTTTSPRSLRARPRASRKILRAHGRSLDAELGHDTPPELALDEPGLAACYAAAAQGVSVSQ